MKSGDKLPSITPILIGFSLLLIGAAQITALWALTKVILPTSIKSPGVEEVKPAKFSPQIYQLEIVNNHIQSERRSHLGIPDTGRIIEIFYPHDFFTRSW